MTNVRRQDVGRTLVGSHSGGPCLHGQPVIVVTGRIAAGKTSLSRALARAYSCPIVALGDFVRATARADGLGESRKTLQRVYAQLVSDLGYDGFLARALDRAGVSTETRPLIIDGVREVSLIRQIRSSFGADALVVHLWPSERERRRRARKRKIAESALEQADMDESERDAVSGRLAEASDLVLLEVGIDAAVAQVIQFAEALSG